MTHLRINGLFHTKTFHIKTFDPAWPPACVARSRAGIFKKSMGARHGVGIGLLYRPARLHRLAEFIPWNRFRGPIHVQKYQLRQGNHLEAENYVLDRLLCCTPSAAKPVIESKYKLRPGPADLHLLVGSWSLEYSLYLCLTGELLLSPRRPPWTACVHFPDSYPVDVFHLSFNFLFSLSAVTLEYLSQWFRTGITSPAAALLCRLLLPSCAVKLCGHAAARCPYSCCSPRSISCWFSSKKKLLSDAQLPAVQVRRFLSSLHLSMPWALSQQLKRIQPS